MAFTNFDSTIANAMQQGLLVPGFKANLAGRFAFQNFTTPYSMAGGIGIVQKFTKNSGMPVKNLTPRSADDIDVNLENNMTPNKSAIEQYEITIQEWDDYAKFDTLQDKALMSSNFFRELGNLGLSAFAKKEYLVRKAYMDSYMGGNSRVLASGTLSTTTCRVDDIRGFQQKLDATGAIKDVSGANTLNVTQYDAAGNAVQVLVVTGVTPDVTNVSSLKDNPPVSFNGGISGQIIFGAAITPTAGHALVAENAPRMFRAGGRVHSDLIGGGDIATTDGPSAIRTYLQNQGLLGAKGTGKVIALVSPSFIEQMKKDPQFQLAYNGRGRDPDIADGVITEYDGVLYVMHSFTPYSTNTDGTTVGRALFIGGDETCLEADWEGFDQFIAEKGTAQDPIHHYEKVDSNMAMILRSALDVKGRMMPMSYSLISGWCVGSDKNANVNNPSASASMFKKCVWYEHALKL